MVDGLMSPEAKPSATGPELQLADPAASNVPVWTGCAVLPAGSAAALTAMRQLLLSPLTATHQLLLTALPRATASTKWPQMARRSCRRYSESALVYMANLCERVVSTCSAQPATVRLSVAGLLHLALGQLACSRGRGLGLCLAVSNIVQRAVIS